MPPTLVYWGIATGLFLAIAGAVMMGLLPALSHFGALMACIGFGLVLAAFGARVAGTWQSWSIAGSGAMAVVLFILLQNYRPPPTPVIPFVYGYIQGTEAMQDVRVAGGQQPFLTGRLTTDSQWQFFARQEWLTGDFFSITATQPSGSLPRQVIIGCLKLSMMRERMGKAAGVDLNLTRDDADPAHERWLLVETGQSEPLGVFGNPSCPVSGRPRINVSSLSQAIAGLLIAPAAAAEVTATPASIAAALAADSLTVQAQAQDAVARLRDKAAIQALVQSWTPSVWNDRLDAGLLIAWVRSIRQTRDVVVPLATAFTREQIDHVVQLTGNSDRTVRYNAAELLSWLLQSTAWPNPAPDAQTKAIREAVLNPFVDPKTYAAAIGGKPGLDVGNIGYNALVALQDAKCDMRPQDRDAASRVLADFEASDYARAAGLTRTVDMSKQFRRKTC